MSSKSLTGEEVHLTFRDLTVPLLRRRRAWMLTFLGVFALAALTGLLRPPTYESHMSILITREGPGAAEATEGKTQTGTPTPPLTDQEVNLEAASLKKHDFLERVVLANGLQNGQQSWFLTLLLPHKPESVRVEHAVRLLGRQIQIHTQSSTHLIEMTYRSTDPARAYGVLNSLSKLYLAWHTPRPKTPSNYEAAIEDAESGLRDFQRTQGSSDKDRNLARQMAAARSQSRTIENAIAADEQKIRADQIRVDQAQIRVNTQQLAPEQNTEAAHLLLQNLGARLQAAETKRAQFLQKYASNYALVKDADKEVLEAKAAILAAQKNPDAKQTPDRLTLALLQEKLAHDQVDLATHRANFLPVKTLMTKPGGDSLDDADLEQEVRAEEQTYLRYLSAREQERVLDRKASVSSALATPPTVPRSPVDRRGAIFLVAFGLAMAVSLPTALILDCVDPCFHSPTQVIETLGIAVVLSVPKMTG